MYDAVYKYFKKKDLIMKLASGCLVIIGDIIGLGTLNPIIAVISALGVLLEIYK